MRIIGGKFRQSKKIAPFLKSLLEKTGAFVYWEPFLGGASVMIKMGGNGLVRMGSDANQHLVAMWQAVQEGWEPPGEVSKEEFEELKAMYRPRKVGFRPITADQEPNPLAAFMGFGCSFIAFWFSSYGLPTFAGQSKRRLEKDRPGMEGVKVFHSDFLQDIPHPAWSFAHRTLIYCDPPYLNGKYGNRVYGLSPFNWALFWERLGHLVYLGATVVVSEGSAPNPWQPVLDIAAGSTIRYEGQSDETKNKPEVLFMHESQIVALGLPVLDGFEGCRVSFEEKAA